MGRKLLLSLFAFSLQSMVFALLDVPLLRAGFWQGAIFADVTTLTIFGLALYEIWKGKK